MYSTCIFCHSSLGSNEVIERFPVGRRLAFDAAKGRLWVVCRRCERWNLTPLEERWEAIEECERCFRGTKLRVSTDNIGLARLSEGLELVRIGEPLRPEFAAWRYGERFVRRHRRALVVGTVGLSASIGVQLFVSSVLVAGPVGLGVASFLYSLGSSAVRNAGARQVLTYTTGPDGSVAVRGQDALEAVLTPGEGATSWRLVLPSLVRSRQAPIELHGEEAQRVLRLLLPHANRGGGSGRTVRDAVALLGDSGGPARFVARAVERLVRERDAERAMYPWWTPEHYPNRWALHRIPRPLRLAMEMATQEDAEQRAVEGELAELERAWREAEEIAAIADDLLLPRSVTDFMTRRPA